MTLLPTKPNLMIERPQQEIANATAQIDEAAHAGLVLQLGMMLRALFASPMRNRLMLLAVAAFLVIAVTAYGQIRLNSWNKPFYDALSRRDEVKAAEHVLIVGEPGGYAPLFSRTLHLIKDPVTRRLPRYPIAAAQLATVEA